jgi:hypothetical protein
VGAMTYLLWPASSAPFVEAPIYRWFVFGGAAMLVAGLILGLAVWLAVRSGATTEEREGFGRAIAMRTAGWMAVGVALWWIGLVVLDLHRGGFLG